MIYPVGRIQRHEIFKLIAKYGQLERDINTISEDTTVWNAFQHATDRALLGYGY